MPLVGTGYFLSSPVGSCSHVTKKPEYARHDDTPSASPLAPALDVLWEGQAEHAPVDFQRGGGRIPNLLASTTPVSTGYFLSSCPLGSCSHLMLTEAACQDDNCDIHTLDAKLLSWPQELLVQAYDFQRGGGRIPNFMASSPPTLKEVVYTCHNDTHEATLDVFLGPSALAADCKTYSGNGRMSSTPTLSSASCQTLKQMYKHQSASTSLLNPS